MTTELLTMPVGDAVEETEASSERISAESGDRRGESAQPARPRIALGGWTWPIAPAAVGPRSER